MEGLKMNNKIIIIIFSFAVILSCESCSKKKEILNLNNMNQQQLYYEYFDYINFRGVNQLQSPKEFPFVGINHSENTFILTIYINNKTSVKKTFIKHESVYINKEINYSSIDSSFKEIKLTIIILNNKIIEYYFVSDTPEIAKLVSIHFISQNYTNEYDLNKNIKMDLDSIPLNIDESIEILQEEFKTTFQIYKYEYVLNNGILNKVLINDKNNKKIVDTYQIKGLNSFYKDYLYLINR